MGRVLWWQVIIILILAVVALWAALAHAHDGYESWRSPEGISCCNDRDCAPAEPCWARDAIGARAPGGVCIALPHEREIQPPRPIRVGDGLHVCWHWLQGQPAVRCWALVGGL